MHSSDPIPPPPATGPTLLQTLGRLIIRGRSASPAARAPAREQPHPKIQPQPQPKPETEEQLPGLEAQLDSRVQALWTEHIPICIEVLLAPDCQKCFESLRRVEDEASFEARRPRGLMLERWTIRAIVNKAHESPAFISSQWLLSAVRSQLHFSQLSAWAARLGAERGEDGGERRRKLSRETCNFKKLESNCDDTSTERQLNIVYSIKIPGETFNMADYTKTLNDHTFPLTDIGNNVYLKVVLESLPRTNEIPVVKCSCKRRPSKEVPKNTQDELVSKLIDLNLGKFDVNCNAGTSRRANAEFKYEKEKGIVDDRMHTNCSENGKHRCNCDEESDQNVKNQPKKLDDRRLKEIAKYKRRVRKEIKLKKLCDSTSSENGDYQKSQTTSIPILQAAKFDRFRAIGCYRNQTYLTLPASRIECKSPFVESVNIPPAEFKKTVSVGTQTDDLSCQCGNTLTLKCEDCKGMVRSDANYNLASINTETEPDKTEEQKRRKLETEETVSKKQKCDFNFNFKQCDNLDDSKIVNNELIKRVTRRAPLGKKIDTLIDERRETQSKRQKTFSIGDDDYILYEKCDYGTIDRCEIESPSEDNTGFKFSEPLSPEDEKQMLDAIPSPTEVDKFRWRFDTAASMVFHTKTGLPLTSSPAPKRRGNNCFDFDDSINGISGIKSALFHPPSDAAPPPPPPRREPRARPRFGPSAGLLGSFEESALKGRLEPVATVHGFAAELGASGAFCPPHRRLPVAVFFYAPGGTNAPYMGHINLGPGGYRVARSGTIQVSLFNPHGTLVKMFVVLYNLTSMPPMARTFLRQRTLYMPAGSEPPAPQNIHKWLRYLIHLRFMTSKSGKLYLHTDIRILVSRKADVDTATAHSALFRPLSTNHSVAPPQPTNQSADTSTSTNHVAGPSNTTNRAPNRVFGGSSDHDSERGMKDIGYENQNGLAFELRSFTYAPENPKYSPR